MTTTLATAWILGAVGVFIAMCIREGMISDEDLDAKPGDAYYQEHAVICAIFWPLTVAHFLGVRVALALAPIVSGVRTWRRTRLERARRRANDSLRESRRRRRELRTFDDRLAAAEASKRAREIVAKATEKDRT